MAAEQGLDALHVGVDLLDFVVEGVGDVELVAEPGEVERVLELGALAPAVFVAEVEEAADFADEGFDDGRRGSQVT